MNLLTGLFVIFATVVISIVLIQDDRELKKTVKKYYWVYIEILFISIAISFYLSEEERLRFVLRMYYITFFTHILIVFRNS